MKPIQEILTDQESRIGNLEDLMVEILARLDAAQMPPPMDDPSIFGPTIEGWARPE